MEVELIEFNEKPVNQPISPETANLTTHTNVNKNSPDLDHSKDLQNIPYLK